VQVSEELTDKESIPQVALWQQGQSKKEAELDELRVNSPT
jgi:hypothetical protein